MNIKKRTKLTQSKFTKKYTLVFLIIALAFILSFSLGTVSAADWSVGPGGTHNYTSIQDAINNESTLSGDTISVYDNGTPYTYNENVVVNKTNLTVRSAGQVTVSGSSNPANPVFTINNQGTYAYITGFILSGATNSAGVLVTDTNDVTLNNLTINNCQMGVLMTGTSTNITLQNTNIINSAGQAIYLSGSLNNVSINQVNITNGGSTAIEKHWESYLNGLNIINTTINNSHGIKLLGDSNALINVLISNTIVNGCTSGDGIYIGMGNTGSQNITIINNTITNNAGIGLYIRGRGTINVTNNTLQNSSNWGIWIQGYNNPNTTIINNNITQNGNGLLLQGISGGNFQDNQLINNTGDDLYATDDTNNTFNRLTLGVAHPTTVSFDYINGIIMKGVESPPADPAGLFNIGKYVDIRGLGSTSVNLKVHYNDSDVVYLNEASLKNFHFNTYWSELPQPNGVNTTERYVYADGISSFSTFAPLGEKPPTILTVKNITGLNGQTVSLEATLTNQDGTPLAGKTIDFTVDGTFVDSAVTDDNGIATFSYLITLIPGTYAINATFNGDGDYTATDATSTLTVYKNSTSTVVTDVAGGNGQSVQLQATLTNQDGTPLAGKTIDFMVNGTFVGSAVTDDDGIATLSYLINLTPDTYVINATFAGDSNYNNTYSTGIMTVYKNATILAVTDVTGVNGQNVNLQAKLTNQDGTPLAGKTIQFTVNGANINSATTGTNGVAILAYTITQTSNTYAIGSIFTEDGNYNGTTGSGTLTVVTPPTAKANIKGGLFNVNKNVYLSMNKPGTIYYTRNGSTPTKASTKYTGYLTISSTTTLRFIGVDLGGNVSPVYTERYVIDKTAPKVTYTYPKNLRTGQSRTATLYLKFSENLKASTYWSKIYVKDLKTGKKVSISKWIKGNILYIKTKYKRASLRSYQVYIPYKAVKDFAGNNLVKTFAYKFKTRR